MCWGTLVAAEFLAGTTGIGFVENVAKKYFQYEVIWITIFIMGMLGLLFDVTLRKLIDKYYSLAWKRLNLKTEFLKKQLLKYFIKVWFK